MQALEYKSKTFKIKEPFTGLFTQGMVCHETYKDEKNNWVSPDEVFTENGKDFYVKDQPKIKIKVGPSESMSKSKKNTIDPENIIANYGADSARLFILSDSPPEKDVQWSEEGINSSFKFIQKLWNLNLKIIEESNKNHQSDFDTEIEKYTNKFIKNITQNLENFSYNKLVANLHEVYSFLIKKITKPYKKDTLLENFKKILIAIKPIVPHFSSECLQMINAKVFKWPEYDESIIKEETVSIVIQINGKKRGLVVTKPNISEEDLFDIINKDKTINKYLIGNKLKRKIYVKDKLMNIII